MRSLDARRRIGAAPGRERAWRPARTKRSHRRIRGPTYNARMRFTRLIRITTVALRFGLDDIVLSHERLRGLRPWVQRALFWRDLSQPARRSAAPGARGARPDLRQVRAGAVDAPRHPARRTSPTSSPSCRTGCRRFRRSRSSPRSSARTRSRSTEVFKSFDPTPVASASVAQVHFAELPDGTPVAVKVLRPDIERRHRTTTSRCCRRRPRCSSASRRTRGACGRARWSTKFEKSLEDELDLTREAANCSQLRRNFRHSPPAAGARRSTGTGPPSR